MFWEQNGCFYEIDVSANLLCTMALVPTVDIVYILRSPISTGRMTIKAHAVFMGWALNSWSHLRPALQIDFLINIGFPFTAFFVLQLIDHEEDFL